MERAELPSVRIAREIRRRIEDGELRPGDRVPSTRRITQDWGVAMATATKALAELRAAGLVVARTGVGTVVAEPSRPARPARRPEPTGRPEPVDADGGPTRARIVRAAVAVADADGLGALSMRRVAADLGVATMSLYRHVHGKGELVALMADAVAATEPLPANESGHWRRALETVARTQWTLFRRHVWLAPAVSLTRPQPSPNLMRHTEYVLRALDGVDPSTAMYVSISLFGYVRGIALNLEAEAAAQQDTGLNPDQWMDTQERTFAAIVSTGDFPYLSLIVAGSFDFDLDRLFEFGLARLLDGFAALVEPATPPARPAQRGTAHR